MVQPPPALPDALSGEAWQAIDALASNGEQADWLMPSAFARETAALAEFVRATGFTRLSDPLTTMRALSTLIWTHFTYEPRTTRVDSPIDEALRARAGVCQDFAHIAITMARRLKIPARYVSGYIAPHPDDDRSTPNASHAWMEACLPEHGWVGFDPTNNTVTGDRHIAVAIGRDYSDVPPTRGVFKGSAGSELSVAVEVRPAESPVQEHDLSPTVSWIAPPRAAPESRPDQAQQQQQ
jgi:transglutaminase-like putative cysteine protease